MLCQRINKYACMLPKINMRLTRYIYIFYIDVATYISVCVCVKRRAHKGRMTISKGHSRADMTTKR